MSQPRPRAKPALPSALALAAAVSLASPAPSPAAPFDPALERALVAAAEAGRSGGYGAARAALAAWTSAPAAPDADAARTVLGLTAFVHSDLAEASRLLTDAVPPAELADWRLWALAELRAARGEPAAAAAALGELVATQPASPLVPRAAVRRAELALAAGDAAEARRQIAAARAARLPAAERVALEQLAWSHARTSGDAALLAETARHLLVLAPLEASKLKVVEAVAERRAAAADWRLWLAPDELVRRADALLAVDLPAGALTTLAAVPVERRDFAWRLLEARALTAAERSAEAYATLVGAAAPDAAGRAALDWERARAAGASRAARGLDPAHAERWERLEREHLLAVARGDDAALAARALERLAAGYLDDRRYGEAVAALRQLLALRPESTAGARPLWEHGWSAYERGDYAAAIALWSDLAALHPRSATARSGRYWTARAREARGESAEARRLYREILAADTADFYARQAGLRLAGAERAAVAAPPPVRESWPASPALARAERLTAWGLDTLARDEIALVATRAEPRAVAALEAVVLARLGDRRASLTALRRAFPGLGTAHQATVPSEAIALFYPIDYREKITRAAARERLDPNLVFGMIHQESAFDAAARSRSGARGLMQLMPTTGQEVARKLGMPFSTARLNDPETSLRLGTHYFRQMLDRFDGNVELALASYNGGPGRISRLWRAAGPAPELDRFLEGLSVTESRNYVKRILVLADSYRSLYPDLG
jgi:soluble lytic murein transglycosylase